MNFIDSYKRLDNLCKDLLGTTTGVSSYLNEMEKGKNYGYTVANWENDYKRLKHCRYLRNKIVHENGADENNTCSYGDVLWIDNFYTRIINQTDPLAQKRKALDRCVTNPVVKKQLNNYTRINTIPHTYVKNKKQKKGCFFPLLLIDLIVAVIIITGLIVIFKYCK